MKYRNVGQTGITCSVIGLGTHQFSGEWGQCFSNKDVSRLLSKAQELGINIIDTAPSYGNHYSERLIGKAIKKREKWIIATKFGQKYNSISGKTESSFDVNHVKKQFEKSLLSLDTDYIDIYQFHSGTNKDFMNEDLWSYLNKKVDEGKIKSLGVSIAHNLVEENDNLQPKTHEKIISLKHLLL